MAANLGAHEVMEMHEVLTKAIDNINHFQLYREHIKDQQLMQMLEHQLQFMGNSYNQMIQTMQQQGMGESIPYRTPKNIAPKYGLHQPATQTPNMSANEFDDRDIASAMLGCHKTSAAKKMMAALECANPQFRRMLQQASVNCSEQAYEVWQYMNEKGYYQVPTMKEITTNTMINSYGINNGMNAGMNNPTGIQHTGMMTQ